MTGHSILAPSSAAIWVNCPGSIGMSDGIVQEPTDETREGEAVHWLAESALTNGMFTLTDTTIGITAPNGVIITSEMIDVAITYVEFVNTMPGKLNIEDQAVMPEIHDQCWGTPDAWSFDTDSLTLHLADLKYGHSAVDVKENPQLVAYAIGALRKVTNNRPLHDLGIKVNFTIVQPRCYDGNGPIKQWSTTAVNLRGYVNSMNVAAHEALSENSHVVVGSHCKYCLGRHRCPSLLAAGAGIADYAGSMRHYELPAIALAYEIEVLRHASNILKYRLDAIETEALSRLKDGQSIPGLAIEHGMGRNKWLKPNDEVITMCELMGVDVKAPEVPITPTQTIAKFKKNDVDPDVIKSYYGRMPTSAKLVLDDGSKAKEIFSKEKL
jgi:hypothetical protein